MFLDMQAGRSRGDDESMQWNWLSQFPRHSPAISPVSQCESEVLSPARMARGALLPNVTDKAF